MKDRIRLSLGGRERELVFFAIALFLAFAIWFFTNLSKTYSGTVSVPVVALCNIDGRKGVSSNTAILSARCRTDGFRLVREQGRSGKKPVEVRFSPSDLHRTGPDTWSVSGAAKNSYLNQFFGEGTTLEAFITDTLSFVFAAENHKKVPVDVPVSVQCRSQYMQSGGLKVNPDSVTVYGEDARLDAIDRIRAPRLSFSDVHESKHGVLRLSHPKDVRLSAEEVTYELPVSRYVELRETFPVEVWNAPAGRTLQVYPSSASVVLRCAFPLVKDPMSSFKVYVDWKDFSESKSGKCVPRTMKLPAGVLDCRMEPEVVDCIELR